MRHLVSYVLLLAAVPLIGQVKQKASAPTRFAVGQVWSYHTRPGEESSTLQIVRIDEDPTIGTIIHISIEGLRLKNPHVAGGIQTTIPHAPFSEAALRKSVVTLVRTDAQLRPYEDGYKEWAAANGGKGGGAFTVEVSALPTMAEKALKQ